MGVSKNRRSCDGGPCVSPASPTALSVPSAPSSVTLLAATADSSDRHSQAMSPTPPGLDMDGASRHTATKAGARCRRRSA